VLVLVLVLGRGLRPAPVTLDSNHARRSRMGEFAFRILFATPQYSNLYRQGDLPGRRGGDLVVKSAFV
jgi:hypothetical protein